MREIAPNVIYARARDLLEADLEDELLALDTEGGHCYGFNASAASVWRLLEKPRTMDSLVDALTQEFEVSREECACDLSGLLEELRHRNLIRAF